SRDPLTERILARGDASLSADTYGSETDGEQYDLADRQALRRVAGLSTELEDVTEVEYRQLRLERVVLAGLYTSGNAEQARPACASSPPSPRPPDPRCSTVSCSAARIRTRRPSSARARPRSSPTWSRPAAPTR